MQGSYANLRMRSRGPSGSHSNSLSSLQDLTRGEIGTRHGCERTALNCFVRMNVTCPQHMERHRLFENRVRVWIGIPRNGDYKI